ncbi:hypothetical protein IF1G_09841 [Cordyceps javanica]|uniref:Uncharacterized protein n=1 Tax=Cordyceps javanica TaxID=43265 RepID=A0A545UPE4_9HYPO|nr:hypothetical protein IF1G_09841 [Cordyceps javanica]
MKQSSTNYLPTELEVVPSLTARGPHPPVVCQPPVQDLLVRAWSLELNIQYNMGFI